MTMEEYVKTLAEMDDCIRMPKEKLAKYADATYTRNALLIKPSLYHTLFRRPWHFLCTPFNKMLNWIGDHMPLHDITGQPMDDRYIHKKCGQEDAVPLGRHRNARENTLGTLSLSHTVYMHGF